MMFTGAEAKQHETFKFQLGTTCRQTSNEKINALYLRQALSIIDDMSQATR
jgi:hypothetical protein